MRISVDVPDVAAGVNSRQKLQKILGCTQRHAEYLRWACKNGIEELGNEQQKAFEIDLDKKVSKLKPSSRLKVAEISGNTGIMQISDAHYGANFKIGTNRVNSDVITERLYAFSGEAREYFKFKKCDEVVIALTGDIITSDRRLVEVRQMPDGRSEMLDAAFNCISDIALHMDENFRVRIVSAPGNESRLDPEVGYNDSCYNNSMDNILHKMLRVWASKQKRINVEDSGGEVVFGAAGQNVVAMHSCKSARGMSPHKFTQQFIGRMVQERGEIVDYFIFGHLHSGACVTPYYGNGGTVVGIDPYGARGLNAICRPSQNVYVLGRDGSRSGMVVGL